ncbi:type IVa pilus pseudopilin TppB [Marinobacter nanhaiticus D15-8W]|uniref:Type IV pilus modification protein PilV n=1 Tax=Marinobacter nanhaiticus D15-8W TaxID=626887 RepID=N6VXQ5_9GAMM|nr:type IV pilus modification protein PilV [Marinobacter nanhaiticus]ENO12644.2 type IV pilus modification protein PilV [Marinobacter nanhaiticus D15-8W]BES69982.1 type IVa pilus pseudopilin TppB [Marinobacter nanhaiticus D15-8W]
MHLTTSFLGRRRGGGVSYRQSGVGLIEVLIAVLVLSVGFLGMAALQSKALSNNNSAMVRSIGTIASYSILDAMRVDQTGVQAGDYDDFNVSVPAAWDAPGDCSGLGSGGALARANQNQWCDDLGSLMGPGTKGEISADGGGNYTITITFNDERATGGSASQTMITRAKL